MPTDPASTPAAPAQTQAAPPPPAEKKHLPLFDPEPSEDPAPTVEITEQAPEAEAKAPAVEPVKPPATPPLDTEAVAKAWQARQEADRREAEVQTKLKRLEALEARQAKLDRYAKEDQRLLLQELGVDFKELGKSILNGPPADPRVIDMASRLEKAEAALSEVPKVLAQRDFQLFMHQTQGKIQAALETGNTFEQARAVGWTPEKVFERMATESQRTGQIPSHTDVLAKIEEEELAKLERATATSKAKEKGYSKAAPAPAAPRAPATPTKTLNSSMTEPPARQEKRRSTDDVIRDFLKSGKRLVERE